METKIPQTEAGKKILELLNDTADYDLVAEGYTQYLIEQTNAALSDEDLPTYDPEVSRSMIQARLSENGVNLGEVTNTVIDIILAAELEYAESIGIIEYTSE